ncbi:MAG: hypothetical protein KKB02_12020, partial [Alphaproteobacteria bacterium]|nr:hypothetical protein [Alphaproteobacteria bacterium]
MITETVSSSYAGGALDRVEAASPGTVTDTVTTTYTDGTIHTENIIRNLNTLPGDPSTSGMFTLFGQFFDHGLDFINKGGQGAKVIVPLAVTDPLYRAPGTLGTSDHGVTSITISRATPDGYTMNDIHGRQVSIAGADQQWGTADDIASLGADGELGGGDDLFSPQVKPVTSYVNNTSPYIDQSQTYGSISQITTLLRTWVLDPNTGEWRPGADMLDGHKTVAYHSQFFDDASATGLGAGMTTRTVPTLDELRAHLAATGRDDLTWDDINNYRERDAHGHVIDTNGAAAGGYVYTGEAILLDINPDFTRIVFTPAMAAAGVTMATLPGLVDFSNFTIRTGLSSATYNAVSDALLQSVGAHYVAGDGRANENFALTGLHHVFHENHNVQLINLETEILAGGDVAQRNAFQLGVSDGAGGHYTDAAGNYTLADHVTISWDPDRMFEAVKLINEMEYQHVAIDQYARLVTPDLPEFVTYDNNINADISLEYSQAAFRFGHSQLRDTIDTIDPTGMVSHFALSAAFLNPGAYATTGAADIVRGMTQQLSNEIDEFVTPAVQQTLLGQPLDLAAINIARGRDVGLPSLNETRRQLHDALVAERLADPNSTHHTNLIVDNLNPYTSWAEFGSQMQHPESLVNFIAAYAFDGDVSKAQEIVDLDSGVIVSGEGTHHYTVDDAIDFLNDSYTGPNAELAAGADGYDRVDLWLGGLAEIHVFTGQLGSTFNAIFEDQMERLMDGDRFYYLYRLANALPVNTNISQQITTEQFRDIIERTTGVEHLSGDVFSYADSHIELGNTTDTSRNLLAVRGEKIFNATGQSVIANMGDLKYTAAGALIKQTDANTHQYGDLVALYAGMANGTHADGTANFGRGIYSGYGAGIAGNGGLITKTNGDLHTTLSYIRDFRPDIGENPDGTPAGGYNSHEVLSGTDFADWIDGGNGDDAIYGDGGDDVLDGKAGADHIYGGTGNDVI